MSVGALCNRDVIVALRDTPIIDAAWLMRQFHVGSLVVVDQKEGKRRPVGIVTDRDIVLEIVADGAPPEKRTVGDIMSSNLVAARESDDLLDTIKLMRSKGVRRLPVVNAEGALIGVFALDDLVELFAEQLTSLAVLIAHEQKQERVRRP